MLEKIPASVLVEAFSYISHKSARLSWFRLLCRGVQDALADDSSWRHLCARYWFVTKERLREWPTLSPQGLYRALEQWAPVEGYYVLAPAFPWGLLVLVRIEGGCLLADVLRFLPRGHGEEAPQQPTSLRGDAFAEVRVPLFRVSLGEDCRGAVVSTLRAPWLPDARAATLSDLPPEDIRAGTFAAARYFGGGLDVVRQRLLAARRAVRVRVEEAVASAPPADPFGSVFVQGRYYANEMEGVASYHFDSLGDSYISYSNAPDGWRLDDGSRPPNRKFFTDCAYDAGRRIFTAVVHWDPPFNGDLRWEYEMVFAEDFSTITSGRMQGFSGPTTRSRTNQFGPEADLRYVRKGGLAICASREWQPGELCEDKPELVRRTAAMLQDMLCEAEIPCDLALVRSPEQFAAKNAALPRIRPGLYVGDYGHRIYGQYRTEVLLLEYVELAPAQLRAEAVDPTAVFGRPRASEPPEELTHLLELDAGATFVRGTKQCGDIHVPMGATTFVALCGPPEAAAMLVELSGQEAPQSVLNRQSGERELVVRAWRGWGTLAMPGFGGPSWAGGWLVQLQDGNATGDHRFGFAWDRDQEAIVLHWIVAQDSCPFLQRNWLPEDLR